MLLGTLAAASGVIYALVKFLSTMRLRRLRESLSRAQNDLQRAQQRMEALEGRHQVERSKKNRLRQNTLQLRVATEELHDRLLDELPVDLQARLKKCLTLSPESDAAAMRVLRDLKLADRITDALDHLSLLVVEISPADEAVQTILAGQLTQLLETSGTHFHNLDQSTVICLCDEPANAADLFRGLVSNTSEDRARALRAGLYTGVQLTEETRDISRFLAHHLQLARKLSKRAPEGTLLMNETAYAALEDQESAGLFDEAFLLYQLDPSLPAEAAKQEEQEEPPS